MIRPAPRRVGLVVGALLLGMVMPGANAQTSTPAKVAPNPFAAAGAAVAPDTGGLYDLGALGYPSPPARPRAAFEF